MMNHYGDREELDAIMEQKRLRERHRQQQEGTAPREYPDGRLPTRRMIDR